MRLVQSILWCSFVIVISLQTESMPFYFHRDVGDTSIVMYFTLHREENSSASRGNFEVVYRPKIDGIPLFQLHPIVNRFMIGYKIKRTVGRNIHVTATGKN